MLRSRAVGAHILPGGGTEFTVWAPLHESIELQIVAPEKKSVRMTRDRRGYHTVIVSDAREGTRYFYKVGDDQRPDPASRYQPDGVHGPSEVVGTDYRWKDAEWKGIPLRDYIVYEMHVGTFTEEGTFDAAIEQLDRVVSVGFTAVEIMPVAQFAGERNWGYDGVYPNAVQNSYGGPKGLKKFVDAAHRRGLAVILDVVYNHLGPEGNYFGVYGPYFTDFYKTPWGTAINFTGDESDEVRNFFIANALQWIDEFHVDALRLDAVHAILDFSARPFLRELATSVHERAQQVGRQAVLIAESELNDPRMITPAEIGGYGIDGQWADDLHHSLHVVLTGENEGYYGDFHSVSDIADVMQHGWLYRGQYSSVRKRSYGAPTNGLKPAQFVVCIQNHDQIGNRMTGDRLAASLSAEQQKTALATILLSPFTPMLFMGEEYGETAPFQYFTSHGDPDLVEAVRKGRREEFAAFSWEGEVPDPHAVETFERSKIKPVDNDLTEFVRELIALRKTAAALKNQDLQSTRAFAFEKQRAVVVLRRAEGEELALFFHYDDASHEITATLPAGEWQLVLGAGDRTFTSDGEAKVALCGYECRVYRKIEGTQA